MPFNRFAYFETFYYVSFSGGHKRQLLCRYMYKILWRRVLCFSFAQNISYVGYIYKVPRLLWNKLNINCTEIYICDNQNKMYMAFETNVKLNVKLKFSIVTWLKYCRYGIVYMVWPKKFFLFSTTYSFGSSGWIKKDLVL